MGATELATFLHEALDLDAIDARAAGAIGFMPRMLVQATLPHSRPLSHEFERVNGRYSLHMHAPPSVGLPYGSYPRLVVAWLCTEAVRTRSPELRLGPTFSHFMYQLGLTPIGGKRGTTPRLRDQLCRLFSTTIRWSHSDVRRGRASGRGYVIAGHYELWWTPRSARQTPAWSSQVVLSQEFFDEVVGAAIPVDLRALRKLRRSPLSLDIYVWLTYRMSYLRKPSLIPWASLRRQFGANYARARDFRRRFIRSLGCVLQVYPLARVSEVERGLWLFPSRPHISRSDRSG